MVRNKAALGVVGHVAGDRFGWLAVSIYGRGQ